MAAYRRYYCAEKQGYWVGERWVASKWTRRGVPWFMIDGEAMMRCAITTRQKRLQNAKGDAQNQVVS